VQLQSCEKEIETENAEFQGSRGVFIRAPAILEVLFALLWYFDNT
jgi:glutamine amidotransferase PdxT